MNSNTNCASTMYMYRVITVEPPQLVKFTLMAAVWFPPGYSCVGEGEPALRLAVGGWDGGSVVQGYGDQCTRFKGMIRE